MEQFVLLHAQDQLFFMTVSIGELDVTTVPATVEENSY
jgi:hypothetical protein